jgi:hypothetical protein
MVAPFNWSSGWGQPYSTTVPKFLLLLLLLFSAHPSYHFPPPTVYPHLFLCYSCIKLQVLTEDSMFAQMQCFVVGWMISDTCKEHSVFICKGHATFLLTAWSTMMKTLYSVGTSGTTRPVTGVFLRGLNTQLCCCEDVESHRFLVSPDCLYCV